ncbi:MAG: response regulator [Candidatus Omnitrophota bacterium]|jgi:CheY-like chemotaxis protein
MSKNILIADDSTTILKILSLVLRFKGHKTKVVGNGEEALLALEKEKFDMAIIDLMMPVMDSCELLSKVKNNDKLKNIPALVLTDANNKKMKARVLALGVKSFIEKPFQPNELMDKVEELLDEKRF